MKHTQQTVEKHTLVLHWRDKTLSVRFGHRLEVGREMAQWADECVYRTGQLFRRSRIIDDHCGTISFKSSKMFKSQRTILPYPRSAANKFSFILLVVNYCPNAQTHHCQGGHFLGCFGV